MKSFKLLIALFLTFLFSLAMPTLAQEPALTVEPGQTPKALSVVERDSIPAQGAPGITPVEAASPGMGGLTSSGSPTGILQFTAGGHVLGFADNGVYAATGSHAYHVEFVDAVAAPLADTTAGSEILPLSRVTYPNLWPGITLSYDAPAGVVLRSTYRLEPYADPSQIRLRYNVPVQLNKDGSLVLSYDTGHMRESAPIAWQEINGHR
ncbi:MAG: hypothetical protein KDJ52_13630, partial [Anaerolineae bacterium]|nr:hypothetical protein [Anaerolineae bacterium]